MWEYLLNNIGVLVGIIIAIVVVIVLITLFFVFWLPKLKNRPKKVKEEKVEEEKSPDALNYDMNKNQIDNEIALQETKAIKEEVKELKGKDIEDKIKSLQNIGRK